MVWLLRAAETSSHHRIALKHLEMAKTIPQSSLLQANIATVFPCLSYHSYECHQGRQLGVSPVSDIAFVFPQSLSHFKNLGQDTHIDTLRPYTGQTKSNSCWF